ncbi:hypothetical protein [Candidatus Leptofilum sp.]|uniref:hypothetical protein n=1 Tax=Candidatus Leptofilum sp. TaxID=3241576 RepID=UPI003B5CEDE9
MKTSESWKTWLPLIGLLIIFAVVTAIWPALADAFSLPSLSFGGGSSTPLPTEIEPISLEALKTSLAASPLSGAAEALPDEISPFVGLAVVAALAIGGVVVVGGGIAFITRLLSNIRNNTLESEAFNEHQNALDQRTKEQLTQMRDGRTTDPTPSHQMPRWSIISNTLIVLMFIGFATMVFVRNFFPEGYIINDEGQFVSVTMPVFLVLAAITLAIIGWRLRPQKLDAVDDTDFGRIPWDFIAVLITGLIMIGLGIGFMAYLNA